MVWLSTVPCSMGRFLIWWFYKYEWCCATRNSFSAVFNVYIDDLSIALSNSSYGCTFGGCSVNHLSYADDMVILSPSATALKKLLHICSVYSEKHDIVYNVKTSVCTVINSAKYQITNLPRVCLAGDLLEYVERYKYLRMIIHVRNDDYDITRQLRYFILRTNILLRTFSRCSIEVKLHLFQSSRADPEGGSKGSGPPFFLQPFKPKNKKTKKTKIIIIIIILYKYITLAISWH